MNEMDPSAAAERVRELAREAGFELSGIATLTPAATGAAYGRWLERGDQAGMAWMERHRALRHDPRGLLPGARSALVVGLRYAPLAGEPAPPAGSIWPRVARYARGRDYHLVLRERLERVAGALRAQFPEAATRACVDTAPLLERELAARAGLGAVGKNTNLLHPRFGSWFLLGELLTTLDLAPDAPLADLCGDCTRCLDACPTGALPAPYRLDANRCLSYWTIEHRGEIAEAYREHVAEHLFGCDVCQEVCPWNAREPEPADEPELRLEGPRQELDLAGLLGLSAAGYRRAFHGSAMMRARREGLRRNAAYALADEPGAAGAAALAHATAEARAPVVRSAARWALARRAGEGAETVD
jgi:epoxyqueuosine reductase